VKHIIMQIPINVSGDNRAKGRVLEKAVDDFFLKNTRDILISDDGTLEKSVGMVTHAYVDDGTAYGSAMLLPTPQGEHIIELIQKGQEWHKQPEFTLSPQGVVLEDHLEVVRGSFWNNVVGWFLEVLGIKKRPRYHVIDKIGLNGFSLNMKPGPGRRL